jgi:probable O-glycosylation ligase (exosortase A-associated)
MRAVLLFLAVFGSLPFVLFRPHVGILLWAWLGFMNPQMLSWGMARSIPFAEVVAITTFLGMLLSGRWRLPPLTKETVTLVLFAVWMQTTTLFALYPTGAWTQWEKVAKILLMVFVTMMVIRTLDHLRALIWVLVLSLAYYGVRGAVGTLLSGGENLVFGPDGSFIQGNNELGLALIMIIPLMRYLHLTTSQLWVRQGLVITMVSSLIAVLGTHSRGAQLGLVAMLGLLVLKSSRRLGLLALMFIVLPVSLSLMPAKWFERMETLRHYRDDASAMARINAWQFAYNFALERPILGGGFETFQPELFRIYAPDPTKSHDAHSIYFEVLAEHGFVGLLLYLCIAFSIWMSCSWMVRHARDEPELAELEHLGRMIQVSLVSYAVAGAFLGLAYFDLYYNLLALVVVSRVLLLSRAVSVHAEATERGATRPQVARTLGPDFDRF